MFYGAAANEADALAALDAVDADLYSLGQPNTPDGPTLGTPNTFMFGVTDGVVASGPVIATGRLVFQGGGPPLDGDRTAVSGSVALYLPSTAASASQDTLVATATTAADGTFSLQTPLTPALAAAAVANDGQINLDLVANVNGWVYHLAIVRSYVSAAWVDEDGADPAELALSPLNTTVNPAPDPGLRRRSDDRARWPYGFCATYRLPIASARAWTTIGELHTPADTELASFTYGRKADSYISKAFSSTELLRKLVGGRTRSGSSGSARLIARSASLWPDIVGDARSRRSSSTRSTEPSLVLVSAAVLVLASGTRSGRRTGWAARGSVRISSTSTIGATEDHVQYIAEIPENGLRFTRDSNSYGTFPGAASVAVGGTSVSLSARSGLSRWVRGEMGVRRQDP